ncbi:MAG TPA: sodium:proton antiporter, partial [Planctomycetaceae bacterium]|nr:sodium:proton antiporter [Planctomycetaceae bacterium]
MSGTKAHWVVWGLLAAVLSVTTYAWGQDGEPAPTNVATTAAHNDDEHHDAADHDVKLGTLLGVGTVLPFVLLLGCIAVFPLANPHWWERNRNKAIIAAVLAIPMAGYLFSLGAPGSHALEHAAKEYVSFLLLLGSLFVISGGIYVRGTFVGGPVVNTAFLLVGTLIASFVGTTGASMLLIRPLLRANERRTRVAHIVVFFIFTVSNCGGLLTPLGDPPLFIGFLKGVPFDWTLRLWPQWLMVNGILLAIFFVWDSLALMWERRHHEEEIPVPHEPEKFGIEGGLNFVFLAAIIATVIASGQNWFNLAPAGEPWPWGVSEIAMAGITLASYLTTRKVVHEKNRFGFGPILEVAILFAGIFTTMIPALALLNVHGRELGLDTTAEFFWIVGLLSSFLDNAPTYLAFAVAACGVEGVPDTGRYLAVYLELGARSAAILAAVSCGAVFMGANTYIGNGPNFMVKAIAEENNVR